MSKLDEWEPNIRPIEVPVPRLIICHPDNVELAGELAAFIKHEHSESFEVVQDQSHDLDVLHIFGWTSKVRFAFESFGSPEPPRVTGWKFDVRNDRTPDEVEFADLRALVATHEARMRHEHELHLGRLARIAELEANLGK